MNYIVEYNNKIQSGEILTSKKVKILYKHLAECCEEEHFGYHFSEPHAQHAIDFIQSFCCHSKGAFGGKLVQLELWELAFVSAIFGFVKGVITAAGEEKSIRRFSAVLLFIAKKNGKSLLASAIGLYLLSMDGEAGAEVYAVATTRDQAGTIWNEARAMVCASPALKLLIKPMQYTLKIPGTTAEFKTLPSDTNTLDGKNVHGALLDEIHQWKHGKKLYNMLADGVMARDNALILMTTTAGVVRQDVCDDKYADAEKICKALADKTDFNVHFLPIVYELDDYEEYKDTDTWVKANPGLGTIKNQEKLLQKYEEVKNKPDDLKNFVMKHLNVSNTEITSWLPYAICKRTQKHFEMDVHVQGVYSYCYVGIDLSRTTDLTACTILIPMSYGYFKAIDMYWLPEEGIKDRMCRDVVPYTQWVKDGHMRLCAGSTINSLDVLDWLNEMTSRYDLTIRAVGYDRAHADELVKHMQLRFGKEVVQEVPQTALILSDRCKIVRTIMEQKKFDYTNPISEWCYCNVGVKQYAGGLIRPIKAQEAKYRIDGFASLLDAYTVYDLDRFNLQGLCSGIVDGECKIPYLV